jgi:hypothetical protein
LNSGIFDENDPQIVEMENYYYKVKEKAQQLIEDAEEPTRNRRAFELLNDVNVKPKLPEVPLPTFDGTYSGWVEFKNLFVPLVGDNVSLRNSPALKIHYLKESIKEKTAKNLIGDDIIKSNNYEAAWKLLEDRYGNKRVQIESHIEAMISAEAMSQESSSELKKLIHTFSQHVSGLKSMDFELNGLAENFVVYLLSSRLDGETRKYWEGFVKKDELPKYDEMIGKLTNRLQILESIETATKSSTNIANGNCLNCHGDHDLVGCKSFRKLGTYEMKSKLREWKLCFICFKSGHSAQFCSEPYKCDKCALPHNKILHVDKKNSAT